MADGIKLHCNWNSSHGLWFDESPRISSLRLAVAHEDIFRAGRRAQPLGNRLLVVGAAVVLAVLPDTVEDKARFTGTVTVTSCWRSSVSAVAF